MTRDPRFVARVLRVRPGEGRIVGLLVGLAFVSYASIAIGESGISALFFERIGPRLLPLMYLIQAGVAFSVMLGLSGWLNRLGRRRTYLFAPIGLAAVVAAERAVALTGGRWIYAAMWVTVAVGTLVQGVFGWGVAGAVVDARQAKRLFPIAAAGGILGAVAGGLSTRILANALGASNLPLVWAGGLLVAAVLVRLALGPPVRARARRHVTRRRTSAIGEVAQGLAFVRRSRLLVWMTVAAVLFSVLFFSLYLPFAQAATARYHDADALAGFLGVFGAALTGGAFLVSMLLANRLFTRVGVARIAIALPILYAIGFGVVLVNASLAALVAVRFVVGVWLQGVASPGWETLINVVPESRRDQTRAFINGGPTQVGTAIAGLVALVGQQALSAQQLAWIGLVAALLTAAVSIAIRRSYAGALLDALRAGRPQVFEPAGTGTHAAGPIGLDAAAEDVLAGALVADDVRVRRLAFEALSDDPSVAARHAAELRGGVRDADPLVRVAAVRALDPAADREAIVELIGDADPRVAAAAAARSLEAGDARATSTLRALLADPAEDTRVAAVDALAGAPGGAAATLVAPLAADPSPLVRAAAIDALGAAPDALAFATAAIDDADPRVRAAAGRALAAIGPAALDPALRALQDPRTADAGVEAVRRLDAGEHTERVRGFALEAAALATADRDAAAAVPADGAVAMLLREALVDRGRRHARSALWALSTISPNRGAVQAAIENLDPRDPIQLANALETLEAGGDRALLAPLLALWEPLPPPPSSAATDGWRETVLDDPDGLVRSCGLMLSDPGRRGDEMARSTQPELSLIERVVHLRAVPLFADLAPADLERVAAVAEERVYTDGETIAAEGELGQELHVVVDGTVRVVQDRDDGERELAERTRGDVIGEMSILTRSPRIASLVASGDVRTVRIGRREFESILRERPDVSLAVMRVLAQRLGEQSSR